MKVVLVIILSVLICGSCFSLGGKEKQDPVGDYAVKEYPVKISGTIRLVGNEPFTRLVVTTHEGIDYIVSDTAEAREKLHDMQGRNVVMEGTVKESSVFAGKDRYLGKEFIIFPTTYDLINAIPPK